MLVYTEKQYTVAGRTMTVEQSTVSMGNVILVITISHDSNTNAGEYYRWCITEEGRPAVSYASGSHKANDQAKLRAEESLGHAQRYAGAYVHDTGEA